MSDMNKYNEGAYDSDAALRTKELLASDAPSVIRVVLAYLSTTAYETAKSKGWHDPGMEKTVGDDIALMHSELSEALEDFRAGKGVRALTFGQENKHGLPKPEGVPSELADVIIRIGDFSKVHEIDLGQAVNAKMQYNAGREWRHGGKTL